MPIYEYKCEACEKVSEVIQKMSDPSPEHCPKCNKGPLRKLVSNTAFVLKGGGWYADAYSDKKSNKETAKPAAPSTSTDSTAAAPAATKAASTEAPAKETKATKSESSPKE